jgi:hypothetical protein
MIDDAFKLTLDILFPPLPEFEASPPVTFSVDGYSDDLNMWGDKFAKLKIVNG